MPRLVVIPNLSELEHWLTEVVDWGDVPRTCSAELSRVSSTGRAHAMILHALHNTMRRDAPAQELEWREAEEMEWGDLLRVSQRGLWASRRFLWDEAARNIAALLACPSAWDGDHFLQVMPHQAPQVLFYQPSQQNKAAQHRHAAGLPVRLGRRPLLAGDPS